MARSLAQNDFDRSVADKSHVALLKEFKLSQNRLKAEGIGRSHLGLWPLALNPTAQVVPALFSVSPDCPASSAAV
jgi:hypothetical protein